MQDDVAEMVSISREAQDMAARIQRPPDESGPLVLWRHADADLHLQCVAGEGENPSGVNRGRTRGLSDKVLTHTPSRRSQVPEHYDQDGRQCYFISNNTGLFLFPDASTLEVICGVCS